MTDESPQAQPIALVRAPTKLDAALALLAVIEAGVAPYVMLGLVVWATVDVGDDDLTKRVLTAVLGAALFAIRPGGSPKA